MLRLPVTFFYPYPEELAHLNAIDLHVAAHWSGPEVRRRAWLLQTYLRLAAAGHDVALSDRLPTQGIVVLLPEDEIKHAFLEQYHHRRHQHVLVVTVRADVIGFRSPLADAEIVQNGKYADEERVFFVPHWPQPGLVPRRCERDTSIQTLAFKGFFGSLRADFRSERFLQYLASRNLSFIDNAPHGEVTPDWHDYADVDLLLAVRPDFKDGGLRCEKPASKLVNAWHAGVPALMGPEYAYRELRQSPLDYIEIDSVDEAIAAIERLLDEPELYQAMVDNGLERAKAFTAERITERWAEVLFERLPQVASRRSVQLTRAIPLQARQALNLATMPPSGFELRKQVGHLVRQTKDALGLSR